MTEDYSAHLIAARKALATAEAHAALHRWALAQDSFRDAANASLMAGQECSIMLDKSPQSGADKL